MTRCILLFFLLVMTIPTCFAEGESEAGIFEIMNETFFDGDWNAASMSYNLPPDCGCSIGGRVWVVNGVSNGRVKRVYASGYRSCLYKDSGEFGETICSGDGCWVDMISGKNFFVTESVFGRQTNDTKKRILNGCGGVVKKGWQPFLGHPDNPYDAKIQNRGVVWGYVKIHFNKLSMIDGEYCIPTQDSIIIDSGSWESVGSRQWKKKKWSRGVWSVKDRTVSEVTDGMITARINITVKWYQSRRDSEGATVYSNHTSVATFYDSAVMPRVLDIAQNTTVTIVCHNNSVTPYSLIDVNVSDTIVSTEITYKNATSSRCDQLGILAKDDEFMFFDFSRERKLFTSDKKNTITVRNGLYVINEAPLELDNLRINVSTPYNTYTVDNYNVTVINSTPADYIHWKVIIVFLSSLCLFVAMTYILIARMRR